MGSDDSTSEIEDRDPLAGAVEHDATDDAYARASEHVEQALGLDDEEPVPGRRAAGDDAMP
jgi:hypothetical protein